ncbi:hypothetical protein F7725_003826 [Dissostichus mawsoni]|uniref:RNA polymerase III subunit Rpc25 domain-containing protein n=1 Tax=Dissostichus mawsoni TaxID=36200 RepID=A0A7J5YEM3_DISMA|nr:hypothetical protein F7725_003826 [Dissostichus mawsoni]
MTTSSFLQSLFSSPLNLMKRSRSGSGSTRRTGAHDLYMDQGEDIRFRVTDEMFVDTSPTGPSAAETPTIPGQPVAPPAEEVEKKEAPYTLIPHDTSLISPSSPCGLPPPDRPEATALTWITLDLKQKTDDRVSRTASLFLPRPPRPCLL